jgi:hypothetical protein
VPSYVANLMRTAMPRLGLGAPANVKPIVARR